ncbi:hypothetical protein Acr_08g0004940 [Actinidia rufa]|uniref:DUF4220 domain-containing protein n=1 Tax=Actinidia rufa TaxID=165716 RepID=A0A7J0F079_9ERIC|nr:hypothetical protein Acr_08g0004940 [Actinidia rufa]
MTILRLEENHLWVRHLIGLFTQGLRTLYVLIVTWTPCWLSIVALLLLIPGIIKYGERVWVIRSRSGEKYHGFIQLDESRINEISKRASQPNTRLVLQAYFWFRTLNPHIADYECNRTKLESLVTSFSESVRTGAENLAQGGTVIENSFKLIEIELGLIYDMLFSKVGTVFTVWGSILRFISVSCLVFVLVSFFLIEMPPGDLEGDFPITIILLVGAIFLEIAGILVQLVSDWVIVWACKYPGGLANLVLRVHEFLFSEQKRWSGFMGQLCFLNFCKEYKPTRYQKMVQCLCGSEKMLSRFGSSSAVQLSVKKLIIIQLFEKSQKGSEALQTSAMKREDPNVVVTIEMEAAKILSNYMMYLLLICSSRFPFCNKYDKFMQDYDEVKELVGGGGSRWSDAKSCEILFEKKNLLEQFHSREPSTEPCQGFLREKEDRWEIMSNVWVEMLCHASSQCPLKHHVQELRHGGEFLTHVWLLLMHFGVGRKVERNTPEKPKDEYGSLAKDASNCCADLVNNVLS